MIRKIFFPCFILALIPFASMDISAQEHHGKQSPAFRSPFRYVIVNNEIDSSLGGDVPERRFIEVLMDSRAFSKKNLTILFQLVSERFSSPKLLYINVFTDLEDVETPEERDKPKTSLTYSSGPTPKASATFVRLVNTKARFIITFGNGDKEEVELK